MSNDERQPEVQATAYLIKLDRKFEAERARLEDALIRKYADHAEAVLRKVGVAQPVDRSADHPALVAASALIAQFPPNRQRHILSGLPIRARETVLSVLLNADSLFRLKVTELQRVLQLLPRDVIARAYLGTSQERVDTLFANLSRGAADVLRDELQYAEGSSEESIEDARQQVGAEMQRLYLADEISLPGLLREGGAAFD